MLLLGVWAGAVADRRDNRTMALLTQGLLAAQALTLGTLYLLDLVNLPVVYGLSLLLGVIGAFDNPARRGFVIELVEPQEITNAFWNACRGGQIACADFLLERGADLNWVGHDGKMPADAAREGGDAAMLEWLRAHGANRA